MSLRLTDLKHVCQLCAGKLDEESYTEQVAELRLQGQRMLPAWGNKLGGFRARRSTRRTDGTRPEKATWNQNRANGHQDR